MILPSTKMGYYKLNRTFLSQFMVKMHKLLINFFFTFAPKHNFEDQGYENFFGDYGNKYDVIWNHIRK